MSYELSGKICIIQPTIQRSESFRTREFIVEKVEEFSGKQISQYIRFQAVQDKANLLDNFSVGEMVKVHFNIKGTKWVKDGKENYITNLDAWRIERFVGEANEKPASVAQMNSVDTLEPDADDLPF